MKDFEKSKKNMMPDNKKERKKMKNHNGKHERDSCQRREKRMKDR